MKNRKLVIVAFLLVAVMLMSIGYAALTDVLVINGTADITADGAQNAFNDDIKFTNAVADKQGDLASIIAGDDDMASFTAYSLKGAGDTASFTFTIANEGDLKATVTPHLETNDKENFFEVYSDWNGQPKEIPAGTTRTYTITVELIKTPTAAVTGIFAVELDVVSEELAVTTD